MSDLVATEISVEQRHINCGEAADCERCPVALAIIEQVDMGVSVHVGEDAIDFYAPRRGEFESKESPSAVANFIACFDGGGPECAHPFSFTLDIPRWALKTQEPNQ